MAIVIEQLSYYYDYGTPFETAALKDINLKIDKGEFIGLIGHTGSGKSTLIQHFNGLIKPTVGTISVNGKKTTDSKVKMSDLRKSVGLVFQYPEYQLFEETVYKDIAFGPTNLELTEEEIDKRVRSAMDIVGLDFETYKEKSPFELSGGQKRRVAIAGVLAMEPDTILLDEPTAGLDPKGRDEILDQIKKLHQDKQITVILVSHSMEDIAKLVDRLIVMDKGKILLDGPKAEIFKKVKVLEDVGLGVPQVTYLFHELFNKGIDIDPSTFTIEAAKEEIMKLLRGKHD